MGFFFKKKAARNTELSVMDCQKNKDWPGLAKAYHALGVAAMARGESNQAVLWLSRANTVFSADDAVFAAVGEALMDDCSQRLDTLEREPLLYNYMPNWIAERADTLPDAKTHVWGLLSMARLVKLCDRLSRLPGCEVLGKLDWAVDTTLDLLQRAPTQQEAEGLFVLCNELYAFGDSPAFWGMGSQIDLPNGAPFQVFDLNGMKVHLAVEAYVDGNLNTMRALSQNEAPPKPQTDLIGAALLPDYYARTCEGRLEEIPQIKAELARMQGDYEFVCSALTWEGISHRVKEYKELDIL